MENEDKVFNSEISRVDCKEENHLYDLLTIVPAIPVPQRAHTKNEIWEFTPNNDKHYIPRKGSKLKVKTVSEIRTLFEKDVYGYLPNDLEQQQNYLLRKIRDGSSNEEKTRSTAINLLNSDKPITRSAWQMLANINPEKHNHSKQYVLWNDKCIQVNGSKGGKTKFICNYDLKNNKKALFKSTSNFKKKIPKSRVGLLRNSLNVKFKPGPLGKKKFLDASHHKYQMDEIELIKLPTPVLEISTAYGTVLEPVISSFINNWRGEKGVISQKFAEFAVSVLGRIENNTPTQLDETNCINFVLKYKCDQNRLLMRRNVGEAIPKTNTKNDLTVDLKNIFMTMETDIESNDNSSVTFTNESVIEIQKVMDEMLNAVEISLKQDFMYSSEDESRETIAGDCKDFNAIKDKPKRRYCELGKLDVTVIKLPETSQKDHTKPCGKSFCTLGCVCESIDCVFTLKQHCGVLDCMFDCKCELSNYKNIELLERDCSDIIPGLLNLDNEINSHLAKEEQKFHQTVIVSGEKSILLKSRKRDWKSSKKYAAFYSKMSLKSDENIKKILTIDIKRLNCENIEPLCMVHNLYKCFCKGKFTESNSQNIFEINAVKSLNDEHTKVEKDSSIKKVEISADIDSNIVRRPRLRRSCERNKNVSITARSGVVKHDVNTVENDEFSYSCARGMGYTGRKYTNGYYMNTNNKILEMEKNDILLRRRMLKLVNSADDDVLLIPDTSDTCSESFNSGKVLNKILVKNKEEVNEALNKTDKKKVNCRNEHTNKTINKRGDLSIPFVNDTSKSNLKSWLETSYKSYKERLQQGFLKKRLEAPKKGKAALLSWDFILSRYRERKNVFFVSKQEQCRTFLAVDDQHPFFTNCINIDSIGFADMHKYPLIIRNLVTNETDSENKFYILRGWDHCWELIGSAVKVIECTAENQPEARETLDTDTFMAQDDNDDVDWINQRTRSHESVSLQDDKDCNQKEQDSISERSKWFVMTVEHDFTEIQFYKKGFFVTYDGIKRSITLARISGKTVRLSSQARTDKNNTHQFGIYAIPCISECCVFIGPYEVNEPLGIEVVKTFSDNKNMLLKKTRGVWLTTNKVDNMKVIEHPLSFLPSVSIANESMVTFESGSNTSTNTMQLETSNKKDDKEKEQQEKSKVVKPIKIRRTNGFYHLSSKNILQKVPQNETSSLFIKKSIINSDNSIVKNNSPLVLKKSGDSNPTTSIANLKPVAEITPLVNSAEELDQNSSINYKRPVAEIAPQIKITRVYSEHNSQNNTKTSEKNKGSCTLILKPEELNEKVLAKTTKGVDDDLAADIEKFLETSTICLAPDEVLVISDDEDEDAITWKDVWIKCWNVDNFGSIRGRINDDNLLSFEFPGFKYSDFYTETEAFEKINQVLARKIYIPNNFQLQWQVVDKIRFRTSKILTPECLEEKRYLIIKIQEQRNKKGNLKMATPHSRNKAETGGTLTVSYCDDEPSKIKNKTADLLEDLEETSRELEHQSSVLWNEAVTKRNEILSSLSVPDNLKVGMAETLQGIMTMNEQ